jgi:hypothetical protein
MTTQITVTVRNGRHSTTIRIYCVHHRCGMSIPSLSATCTTICLFQILVTSLLRVLTAVSRRTDILSFFLGNYAAHAATVISYPGESIASTIGAIVFALVFPTPGIVRGLNAIVRHAAFVSDPLEQAARAGALCMVVRTKDWKPMDGERIKDAIWRGRLHREGLSTEFFKNPWF